MANQSSYNEILVSFKKSQNHEAVVPLLEDVNLRNGLVAWTSVELQYTEGYLDAECEIDTLNGKWKWLWAFVSYDEEDYRLVSGAKKHEVKDLVHRLKGLKLIYPDGSISNFAKMYLQGVVKVKLKMSNTSRKKKDNDE